MKHVFDTLDGADDFPVWSVSGNAMRWRPDVVPERSASPGVLLPPVPEGCYPAGAEKLLFEPEPAR